MSKRDYIAECLDQSAPSVSERLRAAAATFEERNRLYGSNYRSFGPALLAVFGGSVPPILTAEDAVRMGLFVQCLSKLSRYAAQWSAGGHADSAHDLAVYAAMLESETRPNG